MALFNVHAIRLQWQGKSQHVNLEFSEM